MRRAFALSGAAKGVAHILTDFTLDPYGFTRLLIRSEKLGAIRAGQLVQRVLEIETYRTLALLGLPEARRAGPRLGRMEREITEINQALSEGRDQRTSQDLLKRLSDLLARCVATTRAPGARKAISSVPKGSGWRKGSAAPSVVDQV